MCEIVRQLIHDYKPTNHEDSNTIRTHYQVQLSRVLHVPSIYRLPPLPPTPQTSKNRGFEVLTFEIKVWEGARLEMRCFGARKFENRGLGSSEPRESRFWELRARKSRFWELGARKSRFWEGFGGIWEARVHRSLRHRTTSDDIGQGT